MEEQNMYEDLTTNKTRDIPEEEVKPSSGRMRIINSLFAEDELEDISFNTDGTITITMKKQEWMRDRE